MLRDIDAVIVGAGLSGIVTAERLTSRGKKVLIIEKKNHIGGHCYDYLNDSGIYVHQYGPHIFHTDNENVWQYLSHFTDWHYYEHRVVGVIDGQKVPIPFNLNSLESLFSPYLFEKLEKKLIKAYGYGGKVPIMKLRETQDEDLQFLADYIYRNVFLNYTMKQWGQNRPEDIDHSVSGRVPVVVSRDNRYFHNKHQGIPARGYLNMLQKMIDSPNIHLLLNTDARNMITFKKDGTYFGKELFRGEVVYTGLLDELFNHEQGELPYRSVDIQIKEFGQQFYQDTPVVNYPNNYGLTRITEFKYFQKNVNDLPSSTTICEEHPVPYVSGMNHPYYVIESEENRAVHSAYMNRVNKIEGLSVLGRLGEYRYYDMDKCVERALEHADTLCREGSFSNQM